MSYVNEIAVIFCLIGTCFVENRDNSLSIYCEIQGTETRKSILCSVKSIDLFKVHHDSSNNLDSV